MNSVNDYELVGPAGSGKTTFIKSSGYINVENLFLRAIENKMNLVLKSKYGFMLPKFIMKKFRFSYINPLHKQDAVEEFAKNNRDFLDICYLIIAESNCKTELKIFHLNLLINSIFRWWLVNSKDNYIWDESFGQRVITICALDFVISKKYMETLIECMPKRSNYILVTTEIENSIKNQQDRKHLVKALEYANSEDLLTEQQKYYNTTDHFMMLLKKYPVNIEVIKR